MAASPSIISSCVCDPPSLPEYEYDSNDDATSLVLLDGWCYVADTANSSTAVGATTSGLPIWVTFRAARPPLLSHLCVYCPGVDFGTVPPKVIATDADLVLLRVPVDPNSTIHLLDWDYFVYRPRAQRLDLLPHPTPRLLIDSWYVVASLCLRPPVYDGRVLVRWEYDLRLYSSSDSDGWICKRLSVDEFERDKIIPSTDDKLYHETEKTITVGGERGTVAWVDLWRGVFLCGVLEEWPVLRDVPLPAPARGNWDRLLKRSDPCIFRDVTISRNKGTIKYIEMEFGSPREMDSTPAGSFIEWVRSKNSRKSQGIRDHCRKTTTWSMAIRAVGSSEGGGWCRDCEVDLNDITLDGSNPYHSNLLSMLSNKTMQTLKELPMAYPILSMDDDVVYLRCTTTKTNSKDKLEVVVAIDVRKATLRGSAKLDVHTNSMLLPTFCTSEMCMSVMFLCATI